MEADANINMLLYGNQSYYIMDDAKAGLLETLWNNISSVIVKMEADANINMLLSTTIVLNHICRFLILQYVAFDHFRHNNTLLRIQTRTSQSRH